jgi:hypothetical protein
VEEYPEKTLDIVSSHFVMLYAFVFLPLFVVLSSDLPFITQVFSQSTIIFASSIPVFI